MYDFTKLNVPYHLASSLFNNPNINNWEEKHNPKTGEIIGEKKEAKYHNIDITINPKTLIISGSLHILWNEIKGKGNQNYNDFSFDDLIETIYHLRGKLNLPMDEIVQNLECGLNIKTEKSPTDILYRNLIVWDGMKPTEDKGNKVNGKHIKFKKTDYLLRLYDKGKQKKQGDNILRIELHISNNRELNKRSGIKTLRDLLDIDKMKKFLNYLYTQFDKCIIIDDDKSGTNITDPKDKETFLKGINPNTWIDYQQDDKGRKAKERFNEKLNIVLEKYQLNTIKKEIGTKLREKGDQLLECHKINDIEKAQNDLSECHKINDIPKIPDQSSDWSENNKMSHIHTYIYDETVTSWKCIITGLDISHQTNNKIYLLESSIKEIKETDPETFIKLEKKFKPKRKHGYDDICEEIAHRIRRKYQTLKGKEKRYKYSLFPLQRIKPVELKNNLINQTI